MSQAVLPRTIVKGFTAINLSDEEEVQKLEVRTEKEGKIWIQTNLTFEFSQL